MLRGAPNFIHLASDGHSAIDVSKVQVKGTLIQRRSGRRKLEIDARVLCASPRVEAPFGSLIFIELELAGMASGANLEVIDQERTRRMLIALQPFAGRQPQWPEVLKTLLSRPAYVLRRGDLSISVAALAQLAD
jgi:hypothetical protein